MKSRLILQQGLMDGKVIKEESVASPCSSSPLQLQQSNNTPNNLPSGKENRRVGSPLTTPTEILTRSRTKVLTKDNTHPHRRMSESPKGSRDGGRSEGGSRSSSPTLSHNSNMRSSSVSHHSHHNGGGSNGGHSHGYSHQFSSPHSTSSIVNGGGGVVSVGTPSPPTNVNGRDNSSARTPSSSSNSSSGGSGASKQGLSQGVRYVVKIKRFLGTLLHFGCDISPEVGDRVRTLVFNLVSGHLSIEEFHHSLQEVTSFPLRPFVLPFLRAHLPLLQREISHLARMAKQTPLSYIRSHEQMIFEAGASPGEPCDIFHSEAADMGLARKRKASESFYENGESSESGYISTPKRHHASLFSPPFFIATSGGSSSSSGSSAGPPGTSADLREYYASAYPILSLHHPHNHAHLETSASAPPASLTPNHASTPTGSTTAPPASSATNGMTALPGGKFVPEDEWKNIHVMLNCILSMVQKTKSALSILQNRTFHNESEGGATSSGREGSNSHAAAAAWLRRPGSVFSGMDTSEDFKRQAGEMIAQALRATEDRVAEVKRRAEEAVQEVKRQALVELQRAEARACEVVAAERARLERVLIDSRRNPGESVIVGATMDAETCWNCGRKAHETCSGCNMARYCSAFCQHKDWENHHTACGRSNTSSSTERASGASGAESKISHSNVHENSNSSPIDVSHPSPDNHSPRSNN